MAHDRSSIPVLRRLTADMTPPVFFGSALLVVAFAGGLSTEPAADLFAFTRGDISRYFGWYFVLVVTGFLVVTLVLLAMPARRVRLGGSDARPEFPLLGWFAMLLAAGMGIGLVFYGVAEPILHYDNPLVAEPHLHRPARGDGAELLPLWAARLGDLHGVGPRARARAFQP